MDKLNEWLAKTVGESDNTSPKTKAGTKTFSKSKKFGKSFASAKRTTGNRPVKKQFTRQASKRVVPHRTHGKVLAKSNKLKLQAVPLGGLEEVGKNMMYFEYANSIVVLDMGLQFPEEDMLGIDYVIPDVSSLIPKKDKIKGIIITHGHLDHIGAIPHLLPKLGFPVIYGTKLTIGLIQKRLEEFDLLSKAKLQVIDYDTKLNLGHFKAEFFHVNHSIPDATGVFLETPVGNVIHTGDFKFDFNPPDNKPADYGRIAALGQRGVLALFSESTNATKAGKTMSEKVVTENLDKVIKEAKGRIIIASFSTLIGRVQAIIDSCIKNNRKIFVSGRSMEQNIEIAQKLGYVHAPKGMIRKLKSNSKALPNNQTLILTTGSQGETMSALTRMSLGEHSYIKLRESDTVVLSSSPIQGNEKAVQTVINNLCRLGVQVIYNSLLEVHTSGHAYAEDLKLMYSLIRPKYLVPVHGMLFMRMAHRNLIMDLGMSENRIALIENGDVLELSADQTIRKSKHKVPANNILIDGLGVGDVGTQVLRERQIMAQNGILTVLLRVYDKSGQLVGDPDIMSRGFLYLKESKEIAKEAIQLAKKSYLDAIEANAKMPRDEIKHKVKIALSRFFRKRLNREPMVLPIIVRV